MQISAGSYLVVPNWMGVSGGTLTTINKEIEKSAYITGNLLVSGGDITIDQGKVNGHHFGVLGVSGDITWIGGVFRPFVNGATGAGSNEADWWGCSGTFTIFAAGAVWDANGFAANSGAQVGPPPPLNNQANLQGRQWLILAALGGFQYQQGSPPLSFETQAEAGVWQMDTTDPKAWYLKRTQN
jgi:hypothetical protein